MLIIAPCSLVNRLKNFSKKSHFFLDDSYLSKLERMYHIWMCLKPSLFCIESRKFLYNVLICMYVCVFIYYICSYLNT